MFLRMTEFANEIFDEIGDKGCSAPREKTRRCGRLNRLASSAVWMKPVPGTGGIDYATILRRLDQLDHDVTVHVEHFPEAETIAGQTIHQTGGAGKWRDNPLTHRIEIVCHTWHRKIVVALIHQVIVVARFIGRFLKPNLNLKSAISDNARYIKLHSNRQPWEYMKTLA